MSTERNWHELFRPLIASVLAENIGASKKAMRRALNEAFPVNVKRQGSAWRAWHEEVAAQAGLDVRHKNKVWFVNRGRCPVYAQEWNHPIFSNKQTE